VRFFNPVKWGSFVVPMGPSFCMRAERIVFKVTVPVMEVMVGQRAGTLADLLSEGPRNDQVPIVA
jgi:hypothetical protein